MHHQVDLLHHPQSDLDARCFVFNYWVANASSPAIQRLAKADPNNHRKKQWTLDQALWREWRAQGVEPQRSQLGWVVFANQDFAKGFFYRQLKKAWLLGWDPIGQDLLGWHWTKTGPCSARRLFLEVLRSKIEEGRRMGWTQEHVKSRIAQALLVVMDHWTSMERIAEEDIDALPDLMTIGWFCNVDPQWLFKKEALLIKTKIMKKPKRGWSQRRKIEVAKATAKKCVESASSLG